MGMSISQHETRIQIGDATYLQSYDTVVARIDGDGQVTLGPAWDYSRSTITHVGRFLGLPAVRVRQKIANGTIRVSERELGTIAAEAPEPALVVQLRLERAALKVEAIHQFHGEACTCTYRAAVSRDRTRHITDQLIAEFKATKGDRP